MRRLRYDTAARRDLVAIARFIRRGGDRSIATSFSQALIGQCERLARLPGILGRARDEFGYGLRSFPFRNYVIFFRYHDDSVEIVRIIERHRDAAALFDRDAN
jgi:toxin ParE1/3/4